MTRILLLEHNAPLMTNPSQWKVELVKPEPFSENLIESYVAGIEDRFNRLTEALVKGEKLTESQVRQLLIECKDQFAAELRESNAAKRMRVSGPAQVENQRNGNGRVYPTALWDRVLGEGSEFIERLGNRQVLGELEHPTEGNTKLPRVSHLVEKVWREDGVVYAQHMIFRTPHGQIIEELYRAGAVPGVSSRGAGSTRSVDGADVVEANDFALDTWDFVAQPSVATARPAKMGESRGSKKTFTTSHKANFPIQTVNPLTTSTKVGEKIMTAESMRAIVEGKTALHASQSYLNGRKRTFNRLLEHQQAIVTALSGLGQPFPEDLEREARELKGTLGEHSSTLRRELTRLKEEGDEEDGDDNGGDKPNPFAKNNGGDAGNGNGNDNGGNGNGGNGDGNNGDDNTKEERLAGILGLRSLKGVSALEIVEALANRVQELERQTEGQVPNEKYRIAIELGEALVARANQDKKVYESRIGKLEKSLTEARKTAAASRSLLEATIHRYRTEKVSGVVEGLLKKNPKLKRVESRMRKCADLKELNTLIESVIKPLVEGQPTRPDLPPSRPLNEGKQSRVTSPAPRKSKPSSSGRGGLMEMLTATEQGRTAQYG